MRNRPYHSAWLGLPALALLGEGCTQHVEAPTAAIELLADGPFVTGDTIPLSGTGSSDAPENAELGLGLSYHWRFVSKPTGSETHWTDATMPTSGFVPDLYGDYTVGLIVDNGMLTSAEAVEVITVDACGNEHPVVTQIEATPAAPVTDDIVQLGAAITDVDVDSCGLDQTFGWAWTLETGPAGASASLSDASSPTPWLKADRPGTYTFKLVVTDSTGRASSATSFELDVSSCGDAAPELAVEATPGTPIGGDTVELAVTATDADNEGGCGMSQAIDVESQFLSQPAGSGATLTPNHGTSPAFVADVPGAYIVRTTATDSTGRASFVDTEIVVADCGVHAPSIADVNVVPGAPNTGDAVTLAVVADDLDNADDGCNLEQELTVESHFLSRPSGSSTELSPSEGTTPGFVADVPGTYIVRSTVTDSTGRSSMRTTTIEVDACGDATPTIDDIAATADPSIGETVALIVTASDADVDSCGLEQDLALSTEFLSQPVGSTAVLAPDVGSTPSFVADVAGDYLLRTWVDDGTGRLSYEDTVVTVDACGGAAPEITSVTPDDATPYTGDLVAFTVVSEDADNDSGGCNLGQILQVTSTLVGAPAGSNAAMAPSVGARPAFIADVPGVYTIHTVVYDDTGLSAAADTSITVDECGSQAPDAQIAMLSPMNAGPGESVTTPVITRGTLVSLDASASSDPDFEDCAIDGHLEYVWSFFSIPAGSMASFNDETLESPSFTPDVSGDYTLLLTVSDGEHVDEAWLDMTVEPTALISLATGYTLEY